MDLIGTPLGQYEIIEAIGRGGMAAVYKAYQPTLERFVAVKVLNAYYALTEDFAGRFVREAKAVAALNHPNILPIIDFGQQGDNTYIVMKYVPGGTLSDRLKQPIDLLTTARLIKQIAAALDHAHSRGILHRDVKPSNVLLDDNEWVQLADFGLAKIVSGDQFLTSTGVTLGTPAYSSPEQAQGLQLDHHTDIYSLGVMLFEMTTGRLPFTADMPMGIVVKHLYDPPPLPRSIKPDLPEALEAVILKALAKPIGDRYHTASELAWALETAIMQLPMQQILTTRIEDPKATPRFSPTPARVTPVTPFSRKQLMEETAPLVPYFIGREAELAGYRARLERDHFVIITGMAGMGKTTLGAKLARSVATTPGNVFWFTFDQVEKSTADALYWALASFLDSRGEPNLWTYLQGEIGAQKPLERMAKLNLLMASLASGDHVLCFDDFQVAAHLPDIAYIFKTIRQRFVDLHQDLPARIIIMGRELSPDMEYLVSEPLCGLSEAETAAFITTRGILLTSDLIKQLWQRTEGNPKLLELSVSALAIMRPENREQFIASLARKGDIRDYVMNNIYGTLTLEEQTVMGVLSVFAGAIEREGAEEILVQLGVRVVAQRIDALINKHVISETDDEHLHQHSLVRDYCYHMLNRQERLLYHQLAAEHFESERNYLSAAHHHFEQKSYGTALSLLATHSQAIINAGGAGSLLEHLSRFQKRDLTLEQRFVLGTIQGDALCIHGDYAQAISVYETAGTEAVDDKSRVEIFHRISATYLKLGNYAQALAVAQETLAAAEHADNRLAQAKAHLDIGWGLFRTNQFERAYDQLLIGQNIARAEQALILSAEADLGLGAIAWKKGQLAAARQHFERSRVIFRNADEPAREAHAIANLGLLAHNSIEFPQALMFYTQALNIQQRIGDVNGLYFTLNNLGHLHQITGRYQAAIDYYQRLADLAAATGNLHILSFACAGMADGQLLLGNVTPAAEQAERANVVAHQTGSDLEIGTALRVLGEVRLRQGQWREAQAAFEQSLPALEAANETNELERARQGYVIALTQLAEHTT